MYKMTSTGKFRLMTSNMGSEGTGENITCTHCFPLRDNHGVTGLQKDILLNFLSL